MNFKKLTIYLLKYRYLLNPINIYKYLLDLFMILYIHLPRLIRHI